MMVLHIWNTAGVATLMARSLRSVGIKSDVVMRSSHDPFNFGLFYGFDTLDITSNQFKALCISKSENYDILHVHSSHGFLKELRDGAPGKKIIFQAHGSEVTNGNLEELKSNLKHCDMVLTSTQDLQVILTESGIESTHIPNAVDTCLFKPIECKKEGALLMKISYLDMQKTISYAKDFYSKEISIFDRSNHINFWDVPKLLNKYETFIDVKVGKWMTSPTQATSKTALEALACGLSVVNYDGTITKGLKKENTPEYQLKELLKVYGQV